MEGKNKRYFEFLVRFLNNFLVWNLDLKFYFEENGYVWKLKLNLKKKNELCIFNEIFVWNTFSGVLQSFYINIDFVLVILSNFVIYSWKKIRKLNPNASGSNKKSRA